MDQRFIKRIKSTVKKKEKKRRFWKNNFTQEEGKEKEKGEIVMLSCSCSFN